MRRARQQKCKGRNRFMRRPPHEVEKILSVRARSTRASSSCQGFDSRYRPRGSDVREAAEFRRGAERVPARMLSREDILREDIRICENFSWDCASRKDRGSNFARRSTTARRQFRIISPALRVVTAACAREVVGLQLHLDRTVPGAQLFRAPNRLLAEDKTVVEKVKTNSERTAGNHCAALLQSDRARSRTSLASPHVRAGTALR